MIMEYKLVLIMDMVVHECMGLEKIYEKIKSKSIDLDIILLDEAKTKYDIVLKLLQVVFETDKTDIHQIISFYFFCNRASRPSL